MTRILTGKDYCEISGHAPDAAVCHGISAISQMAGNYLQRGSSNDRIVYRYVALIWF